METAQRVTETRQQEDGSGACDALSIDELRRRGTVKWSQYGDDVLAAWVAEMDFLTAPVIRTALHEAVERGETGYPTEPEVSGLPAACASWLARSFGVSIEPRQIRIVPNILHGIRVALEEFSPPDSAVALMTPSYPPFFETVRVAGRRIIEVPLLWHEGRAGFDLDRVEAALRAEVRTVILCNPYNPLGRVFRREELAALAEMVETHGARVVADEVHAPLVYPGARHVSYSTVSESAAGHSITLTSASKGWNLPGLKCAQVLLTNQADAERWDRLSFLRTYGASTLGIVANRVAYEQGEPWLRDVVGYLDGNRALLADLVAELLPGVRYTVPEATYLAWLDCRALGLDDPAAFFLRQARVALTGGDPFGAPGRGHVRLNFATSRSILTAIVRNMATALKEARATPAE